MKKRKGDRERRLILLTFKRTSGLSEIVYSSTGENKIRTNDEEKKRKENEIFSKFLSTILSFKMLLI